MLQGEFERQCEGRQRSGSADPHGKPFPSWKGPVRALKGSDKNYNRQSCSIAGGG